MGQIRGVGQRFPPLPGTPNDPLKMLMCNACSLTTLPRRVVPGAGRTRDAARPDDPDGPSTTMRLTSLTSIKREISASLKPSYHTPGTSPPTTQPTDGKVVQIAHSSGRPQPQISPRYTTAPAIVDRVISLRFPRTQFSHNRLIGERLPTISAPPLFPSPHSNPAPDPGNLHRAGLTRNVTRPVTAISPGTRSGS